MGINIYTFNRARLIFFRTILKCLDLWNHISNSRLKPRMFWDIAIFRLTFLLSFYLNLYITKNNDFPGERSRSLTQAIAYFLLVNLRWISNCSQRLHLHTLLKNWRFLLVWQLFNLLLACTTCTIYLALFTWPSLPTQVKMNVKSGIRHEG